MYQGSAGYDLWAAETKTVIRLDLAVAIPEGCYGRLQVNLAWQNVVS